MRLAVVDLGTNSTRLLVADVNDDGELREVERRTKVTRLGEGVDASGRLASHAMERVLACLGSYRELADELAAERWVAVATSAVREAKNGDELRERARRDHGFEIRTIPGAEEAGLTFLGATAGRREAGPMLVIDIGGGSTEFVVGLPGSAPSFEISTALGSVRQSERHLASDPPEHEELVALAREAHEIVTSAVPQDVWARVCAAVAVAGTATSLAAIDQELEPYDSARVHGYTLGLGACERILAMLAALPLEERRHVRGLHPARAPTIVAGVAILVGSMRAFELETVETSEWDILHGAALDTLRGLGLRGETG